MIVNIQLGTIDIKRLKEFVDWLDKAPLSIENLDFGAQIQKGDVTVNIKAPRVQKKDAAA